MNRAKLLSACALVLMLVTAGCAGGGGTASPSTSNQAITIGHVLGATGFMEFYDGPANQAAQLAVQDINAKGGVLGGRQLKISNFDMKSDPPSGVGGVDQLLAQGATVLFAPGDLDTAAPALQEATNKHRTIIALEASDYRTGLFGKYAYAMGLASNVQGAAAAEWAYDVKVGGPRTPSST